jgi:C1A family cysteine protease
MIFTVRPSICNSQTTYKLSQSAAESVVDLRTWDSPVESQGALGSCVANAVTNAYELMQNKTDPTRFEELSRLFVYYHARYLENSVDQDSGVWYITSALDALAKFGVCNEQLWPYEISQFAKQPTPDCYADAADRRIPAYTKVECVPGMVENISRGKPVLLGMYVYDSFLNLESGKDTVTMPSNTDLPVGGHAVLAVGYSQPDQKILIKNSFGTAWADAGYAWLPYSYIEKYVFDKWIFDIAC